jgi:hypothetical protein
MMARHKHADLIHAWADGKQIQHRLPSYDVWVDVNNPAWSDPWEYRIKPEEKKPVVRWLWAYKNQVGVWQVSSFATEEEKKDFYFEPWVKLEWSRTEFPE